MGDKNLCKICNERKITNKKREMCDRCYQKWRNETGPVIKGNIEYDYKATRGKNFKRIGNYRELLFVKNFFSHSNWLPHPVCFKLGDISYQPDFYDAERNVFIEVAGSRQAYHKNKDKYVAFKKMFPKIELEIRLPDGDLLEDKPHGQMWKEQYKSSG